MQIFVDFGDEREIYLRIMTESSNVPILEKIVKEIQKKEDYNTLDLLEALEKYKIEFSEVPLEGDVLIYF